ncbi:CAP domain-containing protein [Tundrisphaera lichenicola]|uniref:CAP domain-containing protein n=1 Tax=Tundrisphaera lichenicola TaxID=2029860 RepID=UPI003EBA4903
MNRLLLRRLSMGVLITAGVGPLSCAEPRSRPVPQPDVPIVGQSQDVVERVIQAHNEERGRRGLGPLSRDDDLEAAAMVHARDMASRRKMAHKGSDGSSPFDRMKRQGYDFGAAAENVAYGFDDVESVMAGWMRSPGHKRNILGKFSEIGVGRAIATDGASCWCITFGTPATR